MEQASQSLTNMTLTKPMGLSMWEGLRVSCGVPGGGAVTVRAFWGGLIQKTADTLRIDLT